MKYFEMGVDIETNQRFDRLITKDSFLKGVFADCEQEYILASHSPALAMAGLYCGKEATAKALGQGLFGLKPKDIVIMHNDRKQPFVMLMGGAKEKYPDMRFAISISHSDTGTASICTAYE